MRYTEQTFVLPAIIGISEKQIDEHMKLYAGYVKHANLILDRVEELSKDADNNKYLISELRRRFGFEFNGMRNHEYYFGDLEGGAAALPPESALAKKINEEFGSFEGWLADFKGIAASVRGSGWTFLMHDPATDRLMNVWVTEHHLGQFTGLRPIAALDMWEHAYMVDYTPGDKGKYIDAYLAALNWGTTAQRYPAPRAS